MRSEDPWEVLPLNANFSIPLSLLIYIFTVLRIDTNTSHIHGHMKKCHNGHYGHFVHIGHYGLARYGRGYG